MTHRSTMVDKVLQWEAGQSNNHSRKRDRSLGDLVNSEEQRIEAKGFLFSTQLYLLRYLLQTMLNKIPSGIHVGLFPVSHEDQSNTMRREVHRSWSDIREYYTKGNVFLNWNLSTGTQISADGFVEKHAPGLLVMAHGWAPWMALGSFLRQCILTFSQSGFWLSTVTPEGNSWVLLRIEMKISSFRNTLEWVYWGSKLVLEVLSFPYTWRKKTQDLVEQ